MTYDDVSFENRDNWRVVEPGDRVGLTDDQKFLEKQRCSYAYSAGPFGDEAQAQRWLGKMLKRGFKRDPRSSGWCYCFLLRPTSDELRAEGIDPFPIRSTLDVPRS